MSLFKRARAIIRGGPLAPQIRGIVDFISVPGGTDVVVNVRGLPKFRPAENDRPQIGPHGFHIHEYGTCAVEDTANPFQPAGQHWAPDNQPHGNHAGDFPVLFSNNGVARMRFYSNRFKPAEIIGRSIIIHESPDDYQTQPAGDAGRRLACGIIK